MRNYYKEFVIYSNGKVLSSDEDERLLMFFGLEDIQTNLYCITYANYFDPNIDQKGTVEMLGSEKAYYYFPSVLERVQGMFPKSWYPTIKEAIEHFESVDDFEEDNEEWDVLTEEGLK